MQAGTLRRDNSPFPDMEGTLEGIVKSLGRAEVQLIVRENATGIFRVIFVD